MLHVLPTGIKRIRHYGVLATACKKDLLSTAREALRMPLPSPRAAESAQVFMARVTKLEVLQCPCCKAGLLQLVGTLAGVKHLPAPGANALAQPRGPP